MIQRTGLFFLFILQGIVAFAQVPVNYAFMRPVLVTNPNATGIPDIQLEFDLGTDALVAAGKMQPDGDDIAFMDSCGELFYWIEDSSFNTTRTTFWVRIPYLPSGTHTIYMYYGDQATAANPRRNGDSTFVFFDDFNTGNVPNAAKWSQVSNNGNDVHIQTPSGFYAPSAGNLSNAAVGLSHTMAPGNYEVGSKLRIDPIAQLTDFDAEIGWFQPVVLSVNRVATWVTDDEFPRDYTGANGTGNVFAVSAQPIHNRWSYARVRTIGNQVRSRRFSHSPTFFDESGPTVTFVPANAVKLYIGSTAYQGHVGWFDFIFVRNAVANEPSLVLQGEVPNPWLAFTGFQATGNSPLCPGDTLQLGSTFIPGAASAWTGPGSFTATQFQVTVPNAFPGTYTILSSLGGACVTDSVIVQTVVFSLPFNDTLICGSQSLVLGGPAMPGVIYQWSSIPAGFSSSAPAPVVTPVVTTSYVLMQTTASGNCTTYDTITVTVVPQPVAAFSVSTTAGQPDILLVNQSQDADHYSWFFGDGNTSTASDPDYTFASDGSYTIMLVAETEEGCADTAWQTVFIDVESALYAPNAFTPNGNGTNDVFSVSSYNIAAMEVRIYDRWGHLITEWDTPGGYWDGKLKGRECPIGVYVYVVSATGYDGREYRLYGHVSLIR